MSKSLSHTKAMTWQAASLLLGTTWLFAPALNHVLSYRTALISQYETGGQPYSMLFRLGDVAAGLVVVWLTRRLFDKRRKTISFYLLATIGLGMVIDPIFTTSCQVSAQICRESFSLTFLIHAVETVMTAFAFFALSVYDSLRRKQLVSIAVAVFQVVYGLWFVSQYADSERLNTLSQYVYQSVLLVWIVWYLRERLLSGTAKSAPRETPYVRYAASAWAFLNGLLAIVVGLAHIHLLGRIEGLYFLGNNAWLAQHGVIVGIMMLYLSRHLQRGESRARQLFLAIVSVEIIKYSVITPHIGLLLTYELTFCALFVFKDEFGRGATPMTWQLRFKDLAYMVIALMAAAALTMVILDRDSHVSRIARRSFGHLADYATRNEMIHYPHLPSILLADTATVFITASVAALLWILFRPAQIGRHDNPDFHKVHTALSLYSNSTEDYFKYWPQDKRYHWSSDKQGFIAYKIVGAVAFALADPITQEKDRAAMVTEFVEWCRSKRLRACFLPVTEASLHMYGEMDRLRIGASAQVNLEHFLNVTARDKWWRWKRNRAAKQGYEYLSSKPPHSNYLIRQLRDVSQAWLSNDGRKERGFALGYFNESYLQQCDLHYLTSGGRVVAFVNQVPNFTVSETQTIDLIRYLPEAGDAMPYLLFKVIEATHDTGTNYFDLGFVPFAVTKGTIQSIARLLSADRFSARGLEQFKNKFDPQWKPIYLVYDGDLADLALIAINLEKAMGVD